MHLPWKDAQRTAITNCSVKKQAGLESKALTTLYAREDVRQLEPTTGSDGVYDPTVYLTAECKMSSDLCVK